MNPFLVSTVRMINLHGKASIYTSYSNPVYNEDTRENVVTETSTTVKSYRKQLFKIDHLFPDLVGREVCEFYVSANAFLDFPKQEDKITFDNIPYVIKRVEPKAARGEIVLYVLTGVK